MGFLNNTSKIFHSVGQKLQHLPQVIGTMKGLYDVGKTIYTAGKAVAPFVSMLI